MRDKRKPDVAELLAPLGRPLVCLLVAGLVVMLGFWALSAAVGGLVTAALGLGTLDGQGLLLQVAVAAIALAAGLLLMHQGRASLAAALDARLAARRKSRLGAGATAGLHQGGAPRQEQPSGVNPGASGLVSRAVSQAFVTLAVCVASVCFWGRVDLGIPALVTFLSFAAVGLGIAIYLAHSLWKDEAALQSGQARLDLLVQDQFAGAFSIGRLGALGVNVLLVQARALQLDRAAARQRRRVTAAGLISLAVLCAGLACCALIAAPRVETPSPAPQAAVAALALYACASLELLAWQRAVVVSSGAYALLKEELLDSHGEAPLEAEQGDERPVFGDISLQDVSLYAHDEKILDTVSLTIRAGRMTAIQSESMEKLSAVCGLVAHRWEPDAGSVSMRLVRLSAIDGEWLDKLVFVVEPDVTPYGKTIREALLREPASDGGLQKTSVYASDRALLEACRACGLEALVRRAGGLDAPLSRVVFQPASSTSYRLGLARALVLGAPLVILNNPGAGLSAYERGALLQTISSLRGIKTILFATTRPEEALLADSVYSLDVPDQTDRARVSS